MKKSLYAHADIAPGKSRTKGQDAQTPADIWRQYQAGVPLPDQRPPVYGDVSQMDYAEARNQIAEFESEFQALPSNIRDALGNDSANYLGWLEENAEGIDEKGLANTLKQSYADFLAEKHGEAAGSENASEPLSGGDNAQNEATNQESGE